MRIEGLDSNIGNNYYDIAVPNIFGYRPNRILHFYKIWRRFLDISPEELLSIIAQKHGIDERDLSDETIKKEIFNEGCRKSIFEAVCVILIKHRDRLPSKSQYHICTESRWHEICSKLDGLS